MHILNRGDMVVTNLWTTCEEYYRETIYSLLGSEMKRILKILAVVAGLFCLIITVGFLMYRDMPVKWYDEQGKQIVEVIESEFDIPIDPMNKRKGIYHSGWAYRRRGVWNTGSSVTVYGLKDSDVQDRILLRIKALVETMNYWDVRVTFYDDAKFETEGNSTRRLETKELRSERVVGKTASWLSELRESKNTKQGDAPKP